MLGVTSFSILVCSMPTRVTKALWNCPYRRVPWNPRRELLCGVGSGAPNP